MNKTFFITGVSGGLGLAFAKEALTAGHRVVGTVRNPDQATTFTELAPDRAFARLLDVTDDRAWSPQSTRLSPRSRRSMC